jgi:hypothetical protein
MENNKRNISIGKKNLEQITEINIDNRIINDDQELEQVFKTHFETCANKLTVSLLEDSIQAVL